MIYRYLLASGDISILGTSKSVKEEASPFLYKEGIFRLRIQAPYTNFQLPSHSLDLIQNIDIRIDSWKDDAPTESMLIKILHQLSASCITRQSLRIVLDATESNSGCRFNTRDYNFSFRNSSLDGPNLDDITHPDYLYLLEFSLFHTLALARLAKDGVGFSSIYVGVEGMEFSVKELVLYDAACSETEEMVEPWLGPGVWRTGRDTPGLSVEFCPRRYQAAMFVLGTAEMVGKKCRAATSASSEVLNLFRMACS